MPVLQEQIIPKGRQPPSADKSNELIVPGGQAGVAKLPGTKERPCDFAGAVSESDFLV